MESTLVHTKWTVETLWEYSPVFRFHANTIVQHDFFYLVFHLCCLMLMPSHDRYFVFSCKGYIRYTHLWRVEKLRPIFERKGLPWWQPCSFWAHQSRWSAVITVMWDNLSCPFQETKDLLPRTLYVSVISPCKNCTLMWWGIDTYCRLRSRCDEKGKVREDVGRNEKGFPVFHRFFRHPATLAPFSPTTQTQSR